jgi:hypothetical protein
VSTSTDPTPSEAAVADEEVEGSRPVACWSVREGDWRDELPDEVAALLAPPVIVSAEASTPAGRRPSTTRPSTTRDSTTRDSTTRDSTTRDSTTRDSNGGPAAYDPRHAAPEDTTPRFIAPALPRRLRHRRPTHAA